MMINPASVRAMFGDAADNTASNASTDPGDFAALLRQTQVAPAPAPAPAAPTEAKATGEPTPATDAQDETPAAQEPDTTSHTCALKVRLCPTDGAPVSTRDVKPMLDIRDTRETRDTRDTMAADASDPTGTDHCKALETPLPTGAASFDPSVMHWLAGLQRTAAGQTDDAKDDETVAVDADTEVIESRGAAKGPRAAEPKAEPALKDKAAQGKAQLGDAAAARPFAAALTEHGGIVEKPLYKVIDGVKDVAAAGASALVAAQTPRTDAPAPASVAIATPVTAPEFAQELGLRLAVLAKDGVQTAELHLNPADMGPVSVQIVMDGTQARVDFGADMAATRQAIEAGLPALASALRDAGFTLAGGGVSQHAGGRSGGNNDSAASQGRREPGIVVEDDVKRVATAALRIVTNGGVDLFA